MCQSFVVIAGSSAWHNLVTIVTRWMTIWLWQNQVPWSKKWSIILKPFCLNHYFSRTSVVKFQAAIMWGSKFSCKVWKSDCNYLIKNWSWRRCCVWLGIRTHQHRPLQKLTCQVVNVPIFLARGNVDKIMQSYAWRVCGRYVRNEIRCACFGWGFTLGQTARAASQSVSPWALPGGGTFLEVNSGLNSG